MAPFSDFLPQKICNPSAMDNVLGVAGGQQFYVIAKVAMTHGKI